MKKVAAEKRGRGRPRINPRSIHLTLPPEEFEFVDAFAAHHGIARLEACRRLIRIARQTVEAGATGKKRRP